MINSAEQYEYVTGADVDEAHPHGDLDRIVIDGEVMPLRTGDTGKADKDGNAIPRQKILRGEDVAFLMEAVGQRNYDCWWTEYMTWSSESGERVYTTVANGFFVKNAFSRKVSAAHVKVVRDWMDYLCDAAVQSLDLEEKASESDKTFKEAYGSPGLPEDLRFHRNNPAPVPGDALPHADVIFALFATESYLTCAVLEFTYAHDVVHVDISKFDTDAVVEGDHFASSEVESAAGWWTHAVRTRPTDGSPDVTGVMRAFPKPDFELFRIRAPHVEDLRIVLKLKVEATGPDGQTLTRYVWRPFAATKDGEWFSLTAGACGFGTKDSLASVCQAAGLEAPSVPGEDQLDAQGSASSYASIRIHGFQFLGKWDGHTKWRQ